MQKVIVYSSDSCGYCRMAKEWLKENGVPFEEKNVNTDPQARREMEEMKAAGVPIIAVGNEVIIGFDKPRLEALFGKKIIECPSCRQKLRVPRQKGILQVTCPKCQHQMKVDSNQ